MAIGGRAGAVFNDINVTPLTDVFLVLLVIMILVAPMVNQTVLKVDAPDNEGNHTKVTVVENNLIKVRVGPSGLVTINGSTVTPADSATIQQRIKSEQQRIGKEDIPLELLAHPDSQQRFVVAVMDAAAGANIKQMKVKAPSASENW